MMPTFSHISTRTKTALFALGVAVVVGTPVFFLSPTLMSLHGQRDLGAPLGPSGRTQTVLGLGLTFISLTPGVADYYGLGQESGALVTEVTPGSPSNEVGIEPGDIVVGFNGSVIGEGESLLQRLLACSDDESIALEVCGKTGFRTVRFVRTSPGENSR